MAEEREGTIDLAAEDKALAQHIHPLAGWEHHHAFRLGYRAGLAHAPPAPDPATVAAMRKLLGEILGDYSPTAEWGDRCDRIRTLLGPAATEEKTE